MVSVLINAIAPLLDKFVPDADERAKLAHEIATLAEKQAHEIALAQIGLNEIDAKSGSKWSSGWRPFIGWVCGFAFAYHFVLQPLVAFALAAFGVDVKLPTFDMYSLLTVLGGLLGLGSMRSWERVQGKIPRGR